MSSLDYVATPNEAYWFFEKVSCVLCGSNLIVYEQSMLSNQNGIKYYCSADCSLAEHYHFSIWWRDPKDIHIDEEEISFDIDDIRYNLFFTTGQFVNISINGDFICRVDRSYFGNPPYIEQALVKKINTILLLK